MTIQNGSGIIEEIEAEILEGFNTLTPLIHKSLKRLDGTIVISEDEWKSNAIHWERIKNIIGKHCDHCKLYNINDTCLDCDWKELKNAIEDEVEVCPKCGSTNISGFNIIITHPLLMCLDCGYGNDCKWEDK